MKSVDLGKKFAVAYSNASGDKQAAFDPSVILVFADIISRVTEMFRDCGKTPTQALQSVKSPSLWDRIVLRRLVKQDMSRSEFRNKGGDLLDALLSGGKDVTEEDLKELYAEV